MSVLAEIEQARDEAALRAFRSRKALEQAPSLAQHIRALLTPTDGRTERGIEFPAMSTPLITAFADDADEVYTRILDWVAYWHRLLEFVPIARATAWRPREDLAGFLAGTTPSGAALLVRIQTMWLITRNPYIERHPAAEEYQDDVVTLIWGLRARYGLTGQSHERLTHPRPCPNCGELAVIAEWRSHDVYDVVTRCEVCELVMEAKPSQIVKALPQEVTAQSIRLGG